MNSTDDDSPQDLVFVIPDGQSDRLDKVLAGLLPEGEGLSRSRLTKMIAEGALSISGKRVEDGKVKAQPGEVYVLRLEPAEGVETLPEDIPLVVVHEDDHLIVVDKLSWRDQLDIGINAADADKIARQMVWG